jgi:hypothetical protein
MATATGGCLCGAVRYECSADPLFAANCHCRDCQRFSGAPFTANIGVPADALKITGNVTYYERQADSGSMISRGFCPKCGSRVVSKLAANPAMVVIPATTLDDPSIYKPAMDIFTSSAQPWDQLSPATAKFPKMPQ